MIIVHVDTKIVPDSEALYVEAMTTLSKASKEEPGNVAYHFSKNLEEECRYLVTEVWESEAAFERHEDSVHYKAYLKEAQVGKFAVRPPRVIKFEGDIFTG